jgi:riboflavin synthase
MFTGIVTDVGRIARIEARGDARIVIDTAYDMAGVDLGASIACSGVCLTVVHKSPPGAAGWFAVDVSAETLRRTAAAKWVQGAAVNLERAMRLGDELGGHIVTGHVDGIGTIQGICPEGDSRRIGIRVDAAIAPFLAPKGSVTIDGVSLTVNDVVDADRDASGTAPRTTDFAINLIPHTQSVTTLGDLSPGEAVNIEIDVLARYLQRMDQYRAKA